MSSQIPYSIAANAREFLLGIAAEEASAATSKQKAVDIINKAIEQTYTELRTIYDRYIPNVYVVDVENFTNIVSNRISADPYAFIDDGSDTDIASTFADRNSVEYKGLYACILEATSSYHTELLSSQKTQNPLLELNTLSERLFSRARKIDNPISARVLGLEFSNAIRKVFGNRSILATVDPGLGSSNSTFIFFSASFTAITDAVRKKIYEKIKYYIKESLGTDTRSKLDIGKIVNIGHAALVNDLGGYINSPAFAAILFGVATGRSETHTELHEAAQVFKTESRLLENSITVTKELTSSKSGYGALLSLGVTFSNVEDAQANSLRGSKYEGPAVRSFKIAKEKPLTKGQAAKLTETILRLVLRQNPALGRSSRSISEFTVDAVMGALTGTPTKTEKTKTTVHTSAKTVVVVPASTNAPKFKNPKVTSKKQTLSVAKTSKKLPSLTNLQLLLNSKLVEQVKKNMGTGNAKNILNLRTGRFAESTKVERLSQSREGMITAFYSYMRNPYGTFSEGGAQQYPKTRDPKLLISKSIREIGAEAAYLRMRAVLV